jgi:nicotinate-nucleotide adenylyltransferase
MMKKVGIYAGSFDPVHEGHIALAEQALEQCGLDKVFFLVEPRPRRKQGVKSLDHRQQMVQIAIDRYPKFGSILLEQTRFNVVDTMPLLRARFKGAELHLLMGDDVLQHLSSWPHVADLVHSAKFIIGVRRGSERQTIDHLLALQQTRGLQLQYRIFIAPHEEYSSSKIRLQFKRGQTIVGLSPAVHRYIIQHHLYAPTE